MNVYNNCPLDARDFTDYRSSSDINNELIQKNKLNNSFEFNKFLNNKALDIMNSEKQKVETLYNCGDHKIKNNSTVLPNDLDVKGKYQTY
tara:strand:+ start:341 stop:610 length:270 start_codon:yes stop_codon:yes gene_type:complete